MVVIGNLTLITVTTGSVATASITSAALAIANGIGQPVTGRLSDKLGQRWPLLIASLLNALFCVVHVYAATAGAPVSLLVALAALIGVTTAPVGALARVRWYHLAKRPPQLAAALSWESMIDEMGFVLGPALVGILSSMISPYLPLIISATLAATCGVGFALSKNAVGPQIDTATGSSPSTAAVAKAVLVCLIGMAALGMFFGSTQTSTTAAANAMGNESLAGLIYAALGFGSAITSIGAVALPDTFSLRARIMTGGIGLAVGAIGCSFAQNFWQLAILIFLTGMAIGPASVALFTLAGELSPQGGDALAVTLLGAINILGVATANAITGQLVETNWMWGYFFTAGCGLLLTFGTLLSPSKQVR
ncbi:MFS family permease [Arcanobacterium wilhelmae]|uniref:MFS family permease n=2 Tax=Arcanobacterium wilhelmae TaxID=1803177 RepID=A0ABT9N910_9ACTO|nr:MFS transporter [Arcanobacterium wilhelmae]MDP9800189.1 MFS family permease [Arcanobacterium wilhelmae]WFN89630.1 MFS transporter [Arcanobacterium wilhelmae]